MKLRNTIINLCLMGLVLFNYSCSSLSKNMVKSGNFTLSAGVNGQKSWSDNLNFQRVSYYFELTLLFDVMITRVDKSSPFYSWFSDFEKKEVEKCGDFLITLSYALNSNKISIQDFNNQLRERGYRQMSLKTFNSFFRLHPDYISSSLGSYRLSGHCSDSSAKDIELLFPGFRPKTIR